MQRRSMILVEAAAVTRAVLLFGPSEVPLKIKQNSKALTQQCTRPSIEREQVEGTGTR